MKRIIILILALLPILASAQVKFEELSIEQALAKAKKEKKGIILDIISNKVDQESLDKLFADKKATDLMLEKYIPVRMSMMKEENEEDFVTYIRSLSYPVGVFMNEKGIILGSIHWDAAAQGYENFSEILNASIKDGDTKANSKKSIKFLDLDYKQALEQSKATGKPVMVDCYFIGCGPCKRMDDNVFTLDHVADFYNENFICIKLDRAKDPHGVIAKYNVTGYPAYLFLKSDGELIMHEAGFRDALPFIELGRQALANMGRSVSIGMASSTGGASAAPAASSSQGTSTAAVGMSSSMAATASTGSTTTVTMGSSAASSMAAAPADGAAVHFQKLTLEEAKMQAKAANKAIYVDMSATWCQPCKMMKEKVFPDPEVSAYMNANYINIHFDCDVDSALSNPYRDKFNTTAFPTHILIDANGELIHKFVGYQGIQPFLTELYKGVSGGKGLNSYNQKYAAGERSPEFMNEYITMLANANEGLRASDLASDYLKTLPIANLATPKTFYLVSEFVLDLDSELAQKILTNKSLFEKNVGAGEFAQYENKLWMIKGVSYVKEDGGRKVFDKNGFSTYLKRLAAAGVDKGDYIKTTTIMENYYASADWNGYVNEAVSYMNTYKEKANPMLTWNWGARIKAECPDKSLKSKYAKLLSSNFELVKKYDHENAMVWMESMKYLLSDMEN